MAGQMGELNGYMSMDLQGSFPYGKDLVNELEEEKAEGQTVKTLTREEKHVLDSFRVFIGDLCQQFNMGHPG